MEYRKDYLEKYLPAEKWRTYKTIDGIELRLGIEYNNVVNKPGVLMLDDNTPHCLLVGALGSGKEAAVDCIIQNLVHMYSSEELIITYPSWDTEGGYKYMRNGADLIPNAPEEIGCSPYCVDALEWAASECDRRISLCREHKVSSIKGMRDSSVVLPRVLVIIDELSWKSLISYDETITKILRLGRASGVHLMIASYDTTWPVPKAWLSCFRMRIALRCPKDTSVLLLGNDAAATELLEDAGWAYSNDGTGSTIDGNRLWEIPYVGISEAILGFEEVAVC